MGLTVDGSTASDGRELPERTGVRIFALGAGARLRQSRYGFPAWYMNSRAS